MLQIDFEGQMGLSFLFFFGAEEVLFMEIV